MSRNAKVFGIGLSRTGTTSLTKALQVLGLRATHQNMDIYTLSNGRLKCHPEFLRYFEAATDTPVANCYKELDEHYPGSKFIYTTRDLESWLKSCQIFFYPNRWKGGSPLVNLLHLDLYKATEFNSQLFTAAYQRHDSDVRAYFKGRENDLLIINIPKGEGFEKICPFLGISNIVQPFPHKNKKLAENVLKAESSAFEA